MRTTVDIPDAVYRRLKTRAANEGRSVRALILRGAEQLLDAKPAKTSQRVTLPMIKSKRPGSRYLDNAIIYDIIGFP